MATNLGIKPDAKKVYVYRLFSLITDGGGIVGRAVFTDYAVRMSGSVCDHLERYKQQIQQHFLQNVITRVQYDILFPKGHPASTADKFDLTLLAFLVKYTSTEKTTDEGFRKKFADLEKLKRFRNEIAHIASTEEYDKIKFETFWQKIRSRILQLGEGIPGLEKEIDALKSNSIDPKREAELQDMILDLTRKAECAQDLSARLERLEINQTDTKSVVDNIRGKIDEDAIIRDKNQNAILEQLQQIVKNPQLQLPNPGDFQGDSGISLSLCASQGPEGIHVEKTHRYTKKDEESGFTYVKTCKQMLTKGTVTALDEKDYEDLSKVIDTQWPSVASYLGLSDSQIKRIQKSFEHNEVQAQIHEMVRIWGDTEKEQATIDRFIKDVTECLNLPADEKGFDAIKRRHIK